MFENSRCQTFDVPNVVYIVLRMWPACFGIRNARARNLRTLN